VFAGARPLPRNLRDAYLKSVAEALKGSDTGPGAVYRAVRDCQKKYFDPPLETGKRSNYE
jgi:hypothetical protein